MGSVIVFEFNLVQDITSFSHSLRIAITTFDGTSINTYYNLNDPLINDYPQLIQILSLIQSLMPVSNEYHHFSLGMPLSYPICFLII